MARRQTRHYRERGYHFSSKRKDRWWINRPSSVRRNQVIAVRNDIRSDPDGMGYFATHQFIPGSSSWRAQALAKGIDPDVALAQSPTHWADILFLERSSRPKVIYNATVSTVADELSSLLETEVEDAVDARMSPEDVELHEKTSGFDFEPAPPGAKYKKMVFRRSVPLPSLGNKTRHAALAEEFLRLAANPQEWPQVLPGARIDRAYRYGVGVYLVVDAKTLSVPNLILAIDRFRANGCQDYTMPVGDMNDHMPVVAAMLVYHAYTQTCLDCADRGVEPPGHDEYMSQVSPEFRPHVYCQSVPLRED